MPEKLSELPRQSKIELEKYWAKVTFEFIGWNWDKEKWVSLTWSATKLTIEKPNWEISTGLIDFGMFQGCENDLKYNEILPFDLDKIDFVLLTHTHVDHIWKMLYFSKEEFQWTVWTTKLNKDVLFTMLSDVIKLQPKPETTSIEKLQNEINNYSSFLDKWFKLWQEWLEQIHSEIDDLKEKLEKLEKTENNTKKEYFESEDLLELIKKVNGITKYEKVEVGNDIQLSYIRAWHLPGSGQAIIKIKVWPNKYISLWFSWDLWKFKSPAVWWKPDISKERLDWYMIESTYAWRLHPDFQKQEKEFIKVIKETIKVGWKIIIPTFMQWRAQEIWLYLEYLMDNNKIPRILVFYHSTNIKKITEVYYRHIPKTYSGLVKWDFFKQAVTGQWKNKQENFDKHKWSAIVLASWWMMDGWAVENYLDYLDNPKNLFISVWYQWEWTLWNKIFMEEVKEIEHNQKWKIAINSKIHNLRWFSWHADEEDLLYLLSKMKFWKDAKIIINHWEKWVSQTLFWLAVKWVVWRTKEILFADFNEDLYQCEQKN